MTSPSGGLLLLLCLGLASPAAANDGLDRHRARGPSLLRLFPAPRPADGYRVLAADAPGGADGEVRFRWAQPHAVALVRLTALTVAAALGPPEAGVYLTLFDASAENGDTPVDQAAGQPPRGRHPGDSHDGGLNLDLGYYLTTLEGPYFCPDHAACRQHFAAQAGAPAAGAPPPEDLHRCAGPADKLDVARQALFLLELVRNDRRYCGGELIEQIGVDLEVRKSLLAYLDQGQPAGVQADPHHATDVERLTRLMISDRWEGWDGSHHHHLHLRLRDLARGGPLPAGLQELLQREQILDGRGSGQPLALQAQLWSVGLERAVALEVLNQEGVRTARFRVGGGEWLEPDPASLPRLRAVVDLPTAPTAEVRCPLAVAEVERADGRREVLSAEVCLPPSPPLLWARAEPAAFRPGLELKAGRGRVWLEVPAAAAPLVTGLEWEVFRPGAGGPERLGGQGERHELSLGWRPAPLLVQARVLLSGRKPLLLPVFVADR
ncbi:MAG TPA: hypothetical protein P5076_10590 [Myxococcota bacterium]|nr:hypothetical protein [Myxococcota bacterium]